jgi:hypothetical protein
MAIERYYEPTWILNDNIAPGMESINSAKIPDGMADGEAPKLKFNYTVEIQFRSRIFDNGTTGKLGDEDPYLNKFAIIKATRPQPTINYQKVNFYNFRTNVATNVDYGTVNLVFYDDAANRAHDIFENYMSLASPVFSWTNISRANAMDKFGQGENNSTPSSGVLGPNGDLIFPGVNAVSELNSASLGSIPHRHGLIRTIKVFHTYTIKQPGSNSPDVETMVYTYLNPKINNIILDELDMSQSAVNTVDLTFNYDSVFVTKKTESSG